MSKKVSVIQLGPLGSNVMLEPCGHRGIIMHVFYTFSLHTLLQHTQHAGVIFQSWHQFVELLQGVF